MLNKSFKIPGKMDKLFTEADHKIVEEAVVAAEKKTAGEIVPYIIKRSGQYRETAWKAAVQFGLVAVVLIFSMSMFYAGWSFGWLFTFTGGATVILASGITGAVLARYVPILERLFVSDAAMNEAVQNRSARAFLEEEVFSTRDRTGILIFISLFEHRVEVVGDTEINARVDPEDWAYVVEDILLGIKSGSLAGGLARAIERCGTLLSDRDLVIREDDENELSDSVRLRDS